VGKDDPGFAICITHVAPDQHLGGSIMRMKIVRRRHENGPLRCPMKIEWKSRGPEQVEGIASARIVGFRPMQMEDIAVLILQQPAQREDPLVSFQKPDVRTTAYQGIGQ
jgi:hypothetical protein